jgi:hypothetical protein
MTIRELSLGAIFTSMVAYLLAQHSDVRVSFTSLKI